MKSTSETADRFLPCTAAPDRGLARHFLVGAAILTVLLILNIILLRETTGQRGLPIPQEIPLNLCAQADSSKSQTGLKESCVPWLASHTFRIVSAHLFASVLALVCLAKLHTHGSPIVPVALVALVAFLILGPYSYLAGAMSLNTGGQGGSGTASGLIDDADPNIDMREHRIG